MLELEVHLGPALVGVLRHDGANNQFGFEYAASWLSDRDRFALSPALPLPRMDAPDDARMLSSSAVRNFFENLLPEGEALEDAARAHGIGKSNLMGLLVALGRETAGALRILPRGQQPPASLDSARSVSPEELSERIRARQALPFSVWDGSVRLSIAGLQDKIAVLETADQRWYLTQGAHLASSVILKPVPARDSLASLPFNEHACMRLAAALGLPVAQTRLAFVPEPVLVVQRFDRKRRPSNESLSQPSGSSGRDVWPPLVAQLSPPVTVQRLHVIDGCQALGLPPSFKQERAYGDAPAVQHHRSGASLPALFSLLKLSTNPLAQRLQLLRWAIFNVLIGNSDAHGKNISFWQDSGGLRLAPAYDLVSVASLPAAAGIDTTMAMAIGDAFRFEEITAFEWAQLAKAADLAPKMVAKTLREMAIAIGPKLRGLANSLSEDGVPPDVLHAIEAVLDRHSAQQLALAGRIAAVDPADL